jgi:hypothetical protein
LTSITVTGDDLANMTRMSRRLLALLAVLGLLFGQVSLAAYACASAAALRMSADCPGHSAPADTDAACALHCDVAVTAPAPQHPDLGVPLAPPLLAPVLTPTLPRYTLSRASFGRDTMATAPPVAIRFCRLTI